MTISGAPAPEVVPTSEGVPTGVRVASTLCWLVGILTILVTVAIGIPTIGHAGDASLFVAINVTAGLLVCVAGYLVRKRRKIGALLVVLAWAFPTVWSLVGGAGPRSGNFLLFAAMVALLFNWKHLR